MSCVSNNTDCGTCPFRDTCEDAENKKQKAENESL